MEAKLHFRWGSMNTGKSTLLLQIAYNYEDGGHKVAVFTSAVDDRTRVGEVSSRLGLRRSADIFDAQTDFFELLSAQKDIACVLVDEAQFLKATQVQQLHRITALCSVPVMCFGLRTDFRGVPFEGAASLLALAEDLQEIATVCACGRNSTMNMRMGADGNMLTDGPQVLIGGNSVYRQVCARCYYKAQAKAEPSCTP